MDMIGSVCSKGNCEFIMGHLIFLSTEIHLSIILTYILIYQHLYLSSVFHLFIIYCLSILFLLVCLPASLSVCLSFIPVVFKWGQYCSQGHLIISRDIILSCHNYGRGRNDFLVSSRQEPKILLSFLPHTEQPSAIKKPSNTNSVRRESPPLFLCGNLPLC